MDSQTESSPQQQEPTQQPDIPNDPTPNPEPQPCPLFCVMIIGVILTLLTIPPLTSPLFTWATNPTNITVTCSGIVDHGKVTTWKEIGAPGCRPLGWLFV